ncbi:hypothetical protein CLV47_104128 [Antricoccus suffuscus]|uniref:DUF559 domain-containing protein n=1 Tax=Antricoccus suffuscus TaxID=1629062 RepID=A0A2T1A2E7_9ACTN|nr:hypothetical protein [Antricoccus suffuscus]PRZ42781.1 hypothetical protein CLV47_104128 [Antricoccus suffuscus]
MSLINDGMPFISLEHLEFGMTRKELRDAVRERALRRLFRGVYVDASVPDSRELRVTGIRLVAPPHAIICDGSASWIYGVDTFRPSDWFRLTPSVVIPHGSSRVRHPNVDCREAFIDPNDVMEIDSLLITTPLRTTADLLRQMRRPYALAAADGLARAKLVCVDEVVSYVQRLRGFPGIVQARELARLIDVKSESPGESWTRLRLLDAGFPRPQAQIIIKDQQGNDVYRLDMGYREKRIAVEYDGAEFHTSPEDKAHDESRRDFLREQLGWRIAVGDKKSILGQDERLELEVGGWLYAEPNLPRMW